MAQFSLNDFLNATAQNDSKNDYFQLENERMLEVNLNGDVWTKKGAMVAYIGQIRFTREGVLEQGVGAALKKFATGEGTKLTKASGQGRLYLADSGKSIHIMRLAGESIVVNGNDLLAFEPTIQWEIKLMRKLAAIASSGFFNVVLSGQGLIAITTHFQPLTLRVTPSMPVRTDPNATICWSGSLTPEFKTDISLKTFFGRGSGESIQMEFQGDGFVVVQPFEEIPVSQTSG